MNDYLLLIDGSSLLSTQFYGNLPKEILFAKTMEEKEAYFHKIMMTSTGVYTNGVFGFLRYLFKILKDQCPAYLAVAWDMTRDTFRRELYEDYKGNRKEIMKPLKDQFDLCQEVLANIGVCQLMDRRYEADDLCGSAARTFEDRVPVCILTKDNDYLQLVTEKTTLWLMHSTPEKTQELFAKYHIERDVQNVPDRVFPYTPSLVEQEFGVPPCHVNSLKGLQGDSSDNIKGVPGVGPVSAVRLIQEYKTVAGLYEAIEGLDAAGEKALKAYWKEKLGITRSPLSFLLKESEDELVGKKAAFLSEQLATIKTDIPLEYSLQDLALSIDEEAVRKELKRLEFRTLSYEAPAVKQAAPETSRQTAAGEEKRSEAMAFLKTQKSIGLAAGGDRSVLAGFAVSAGGRSFYFPEQGEEAAALIREICSGEGQVFVTELKPLLHHLGLAYSPDIHDISLAAYLVNPLPGSYTVQELSEEYRKIHLPAFKDLFGRSTFAEAAENEAWPDFLMSQAETAGETGPLLLRQLASDGMEELYRSIELPLTYDLYRMEKKGILVQKDELRAYGEALVDGIEQLKGEIWELAGEEFNILSPKQLGEVLFDHLKLPGAKKTKSGYSTSADVLDRLAPRFPIVQKVLSYRQLTKLKSTYADGLAECIGPDGRIHGTLNQTSTATGRSSSAEPNLQNIPVRVELGRAIRKVFVPAPGHVFVDADYSQIELRVLAHMSGDQGLIEAYRTAVDIHALTASQVFHVPLDEVTPQLRRNAKAVNFGIVYGISAFGLSEDLSISRGEAMEYIEHYFETFPGVKRYLDNCVEEGRTREYVTTLYGRRRPVPELRSANYMQRQFGERIAMNSPIQGTAADIMKIAMTRVNRRLDREGIDAAIVLQIHDELLLEVAENDREAACRILVEEMQGAASLSVPLEVSLSTGYSWYETK